MCYNKKPKKSIQTVRNWKLLLFYFISHLFCVYAKKKGSNPAIGNWLLLLVSHVYWIDIRIRKTWSLRIWLCTKQSDSCWNMRMPSQKILVIFVWTVDVALCSNNGFGKNTDRGYFFCLIRKYFVDQRRKFGEQHPKYEDTKIILRMTNHN